MVKKVIKNIMFSGIEQVILIMAQFVSSILIIRNLPRESYGMLGVVAGYYVFFNVFNITIESIILRDHEKYKENIKNILSDFVALSLIKLTIIFFLSVLLAYFLYEFYFNINLIYAVGISFIVLAGQALISPFIIYYSAKFNQKLVTKISVLRTIIRLLLLLGLFYFKSLYYYFLVEFFVNIIFCGFWFVVAKRKLNFDIFSIFYFNKINWRFIKESIMYYSLWTHLNGVVTNFVYRSDTFFLSFFVGLIDIGNYNVSLNSSNIANILPSILGYQNSIVLSDTKEKERTEKITNMFIKTSIYLGLITLIGFGVLGITYLKLITGEENVIDMYIYLLLIVFSLVIIKTISSPLVSLINIKGNVKSFFINVSIPLFIVVTISYTLSACFYGILGVAIANVFNAFLWLFLVYLEFKKYNYKVKWAIRLKADFIELKNYFKL